MWCVTWQRVICSLISLAISMVVPAGMACADDLSETMVFDLVPPMKPVEIFGNAWFIYAHGIIDRDAPERLVALIKANDIAGRSGLYLSSPGGDLFAGMRLGRLIRE